MEGQTFQINFRSYIPDQACNTDASKILDRNQNRSGKSDNRNEWRASGGRARGYAQRERIGRSGLEPEILVSIK
jgi:hypothetical protein